MGERVAASGAPSDYYGEEVDVLARYRRWRAQYPPRTVPLAAQWGRRRAQHPPRTYARARLQRTQAWRLEADPSLAFGCAFGAPTSTLEVDAEFLCVPVARGLLGEGEERTPPIGASDDLFVYRRSASGERREHTTSVARWLELAKTRPMVFTCSNAYPRRLGRVLGHVCFCERLCLLPSL